MVNISEYLLSKNKTVNNDPIKGEIAYDWDDDTWEIREFCKFEEKNKVKESEMQKPCGGSKRVILYI